MASSPPVYTNTPYDVASFDTGDGSWRNWGSAVWDAIALQPVYQAMGRSYDMITTASPERFNPFRGDYLKGYEGYADEFINTYSRAEADAMKARIEKNNVRRANVEQNLGFGGIMLAELFNPVNLIPLPGVTGVGFGRGLVRGMAGFGATLAAEETLRQVVDPTATSEESWNNMVYGTLFGGIVSGGLGMYGAANARELGERFAAEIRTQAQGDSGAAVDLEPITHSGTNFVARPTGNVETGVARAYGLENQTKLTLWGRLKASGVRAVEDFADALAGDYGTMSARNRQGLATETSAYLASQLWRGQAADFTTNLKRVYARYLKGGDGGVEVMGVNLATAPQELREVFGRGGRADGKMTFEEFKDAIFRAHKRDGIETDNPFVREGVDLTRKFFDGAMEKGVASGAIRSAEGFKVLLQRRAAAARSKLARFDELAAKTDRSVNETVELMELAAQQEKMLRWFDQQLDADLPTDEGLAAVLDEIERAAAERLAQKQATRDSLVAKGEQRRNEVADLLNQLNASIEARAAKDARLLEYFNQKEAQTGLTERERAYQEQLVARLGQLQGERAGRIFIEYAPPEVDGIKIAYGPTGKRASAYFDRSTGTVHFDLTAVLESWQAKPWREPKVEGVKALTDDMFPTPEAWAEFVLRHELAHTRVERFKAKGNQAAAYTKADYENAMNAIAFEEMRHLFDVPAIERFATPKQQELVAKLKSELADNPGAILTKRQREYLDALEAELAGKADSYAGPKNEPNYISRVWDIDAVRHDPERLTTILEQWFKENPLPGASMNDGAIRRRAEEAVSQIMREAELGELQIARGGGGASFLSSRKIDIPNELVADFLVTDVEQIVRHYSHRFGLVHEFARKFGTSDAEDAMDDVILQSIRELDMADVTEGMNQIGKLRQDMTTLRDTVTGAIYSTDPAMMNRRRLAAGLRAYGTVTSLGRAALSSVPELARGMMVMGASRVFGFALDGLLANRKALAEVGEEMRALTGEGVDAVLSTAPDRIVETGGPTGAASNKLGRMMQKGVDFVHGPYFLLNGLAAFTDMTKRLNMTFINQFMIEDMAKLVETGDPKLAERLASYGLSADDARRIVQEMPIEKEGRIYLPNVGEWSDGDLATRYLAAVTGMSRRIVPTAGVADLPQFVKGFIAGREFPLLTLPFQFMNYGFAAVNKVLLSSLQGRDQSPLTGMAMMIGLGWMSQQLKTDDEYWHRLPLEEKVLRSFDSAGVLGLYQDLPHKLEVMTGGTLGVRPALAGLGLDVKPFNSDPNYADYADLGGPAVGKIADLTRILAGDDMGDREMAGIIRRSVPLNDVLWWRDSLVSAERYAFEAMED